MDIFSGVVFIILFILIMVIVFSMGLISTYIGKKEIAFIIMIGFVLGGVGGYFFIEPIYEESPYIGATLYGLFTTENEHINLILPTSSNVTQISSEILNQDGVESISTNGFDLKTNSYTNSQQKTIETHLNSMNEIKSFKLNNDIISVNLAEDSQSTATLGSLVSWLSKNGVSSEFAFIHLQVNVKSSSVKDIKTYLEDKHYTVNSVEGPVQSLITHTSDSLLSQWVIIIITGLIGVCVSIAGIYADSVIGFFRKGRR
ncbi:MAG: hypothetical protein MJ203_04515 [archaeon]|nr:hypothetical protein [archaeon]